MTLEEVVIETDDLGWVIDLPCPHCEDWDCSGRISAWLPNRSGNVESGFVGIKDALGATLTFLTVCGKEGDDQ